MFDLHLREETGDFRNKVEVILEQICLEHCREVLRNLLALLSSALTYVEAALEIISDLRDIRNVNVLIGFIILDELEVHFLGEEELQEEVH